MVHVGDFLAFLGESDSAEDRERRDGKGREVA